MKGDARSPVFEMPEAPLLPSDDVEYSVMDEEQVRGMVERLTSLVYQRCHGSLFDEHRLLFATLLCLNIQEESTAFTEEELSLLLQGARTLSDVTVTSTY